MTIFSLTVLQNTFKLTIIIITIMQHLYQQHAQQILNFESMQARSQPC